MTREVPIPRPPTNLGRRFPAEPLTRDELAMLVATASPHSTSGIRSRALIGVLYGAGLRLAEALALYPRDIDMEAETIRVQNGKGAVTRTVGCVPHKLALVARWVDRRPGLGLNGRHPVFATYEAGRVGLPLNPRYVRRTIADLGAAAGIEKRVHPHGLRHTLANHMANDGVPVHVISAQLGHRNIATTNVYIQGLTPTQLVGAMRGLSW